MLSVRSDARDLISKLAFEIVIGDLANKSSVDIGERIFFGATKVMRSGVGRKCITR